MSVLKKTAFLSLLTLCTPVPQAAAVEYNLDPQHMSMMTAWNHSGSPNPTAYASNISGRLSFDKENSEESSVSIALPIKTTDTYVKVLTDELLGKEYFDVKASPEATFRSTKMESKGDSKYDVEGDLAIKDITESVVLHAAFNKQGIRPMVKKEVIGSDATRIIRRSDFKLDKYVPAVSDDVTITLSTEAYAE